MSKLNIGVGDEFPLDEGQPEEPRRHGRHRHRGHHHHAHHHSHHRHARRGILHLPLLLAVAAIAALIGAGHIPALATHLILAIAGITIALAVIAHFVQHRCWHARRSAP